MSTESVTEYTYADEAAPWWNTILVPPMLALAPGIGEGSRVLDIGCGNGYVAGVFLEKGCTVVGVDPSESGIEAARAAHPRARFEIDVATTDLRERLKEEAFDLVISSEVAEHVYDADEWAVSCHNALKPGGMLVLTTPYHGYLKNLAIAVTDRWDHHHTSLEAGNHIKFWSRATMTTLLERNGFQVKGFRGAGRLPYLWNSMAMSAIRTETRSADGRAR